IYSYKNIKKMLFQYIITIRENIFFYFFILALISLVTSIISIFRIIKKKNEKIMFQQKQNASRIDTIKEKYTDILDGLRVEMVKHENERVRQWMESEKETLHVLNGVSVLLELSDKVDKSEFKNINNKLKEIENLLINSNK
ncbi:MAG: hypothetical protein PF487_09885, partial [Bacteroidales bacterium]|nr:hypothetical protein [Bacteroidales bacterium]